MSSFVKSSRAPLIGPEGWKKISSSYPELNNDMDRHLLDVCVEQYRVLRLNPRQKSVEPHAQYRIVKNEIQRAYQVENKSFEALERIVKNESLIHGFSSERHFEKCGQIIQGMNDGLAGKQRLLGLYKDAIVLCDEGINLWGPKGSKRGIKLNEPLYHLIWKVSRVLRRRTGRVLSRTDKDVLLLWNLAKIVDANITIESAENAIGYFNRKMKKVLFPSAADAGATSSRANIALANK